MIVPAMIVPAETPEQIALVRALFEEYWSSFGFTPCFQGFADEVAALPGKYAQPHGRLALAEVEGIAAGCVAMRRVDPSRCEVKRLYVRPNARGSGVGRALLHWVIAQARCAGYGELLADTMPVMAQALAMYDRMGFERTGPYSTDATPGAIYLRLLLS
jgi:putative acetyltransferase